MRGVLNLPNHAGPHGRSVARVETLADARDGGTTAQGTDTKAIPGPYREFLDAMPQEAALLDIDGCIRAVNAAWLRFAEQNGLAADEFLGTNYIALCDGVAGAEESAARQVGAALRGIITGRRDVLRMTYPCHSADQRRWFRMLAHRVGDWVLVQHVDVSAEYTHVPEAFLSDYDAVLAHELRLPLAEIIGHLSTALDSLQPNEASRRVSTALERAAERAYATMEVIDGLLGQRPVGDGDHRRPEQPVDLDTVSEALISVLRPMHQDLRFEVVRDGPGPFRVLGRGGNLRRVVANLLSNAIKQNQPGGAVTVTLRRDRADGIELEVRDTGQGVSTEALSQALQGGAQGSDATAADHESWDLGLGVVGAICALHDASIAAESAPGDGTLVTVRFPSWRTLDTLAPVDAR